MVVPQGVYPCSGESCLISVYCASTCRAAHWAFCSCGVVASTIPCCLVLLEMAGWSWLLILGMRASIHSVLMVLLVSVHEGSPLGELHRCIREGVKVNVHIRTFKGLRGVCTGFLVAFDKFWNMVIKPSSTNWSTS